MKLPFIKWFPNDWLAEPSLRTCSLAARGLWIDMLSLMHLSPRRGYLLATTGLPLTPEQLARMTGCSADEATRLLGELRTSGACSCTDDGVIYCRRMVRDEAKRDKCADAGRRGGGNPTFKGRPKGAPKGHPKGVPKPLEARGQSLEDQKPEDPHTPADAGVGGAPKSRPRRPRADHEADPLFVRFWAAYPRKVGKPQAAAAFAKHSPDEALLAAMLAAVARQRESWDWRKEDGRYIPHPSTWLNARRWEDAPPAPAPRPAADPAAAAARSLAVLDKLSATRAPPMRGFEDVPTDPDPASQGGDRAE